MPDCYCAGFVLHRSSHVPEPAIVARSCQLNARGFVCQLRKRLSEICARVSVSTALCEKWSQIREDRCPITHIAKHESLPRSPGVFTVHESSQAVNAIKLGRFH